MDLFERMRADWDRRAMEDIKYYISCERRGQDDAEFYCGAEAVVLRIRRDYAHLPSARSAERNFLEIGCGIGRLMLSLSADCRQIHGVDISPEMIAAGRTRLAHVRNVRFHLVRSSGLAMLTDSSLDLAYSYAVFQHLPEKVLVYRYMEEALRVLRPGGLFISQLSCAPPAETRCDTWVGVWFREPELLARANEMGWKVLSS